MTRIKLTEILSCLFYKKGKVAAMKNNNRLKILELLLMKRIRQSRIVKTTQIEDKVLEIIDEHLECGTRKTAQCRC